MAKVYVVTEGSYSDFHIVAVFSTHEKAEAYRADRVQHNKYSDLNDIDEYELDMPREALPGAFVVTIDKDGAVIENESGFFGAYRATDVAHHWPAAAWNPRDRFVGYGLTFEHARRSAEELRRQWMTLHMQPGSPDA